jgi:hypothetical protein
MAEHAFIDTVGTGYVELALELGVRPDRIDTIADFTAPATVLGMSCSFRSRKTSKPRPRSVSSNPFPAA